MTSQNQIKSACSDCEQATVLLRSGKPTQAAKLFVSVASTLVDAGETDSKALADAYLGLMGIEFGRACRNKRGGRNMRNAIAWYDQAIDVYRESDDARTLSVNLTNMSGLLYDVGQTDRAIEAAREGLDIAETLDDPHGHFRLAAWNRYADYCRRAGQLDEAEKTLKRGLAVVHKKSSEAAILGATLASVYEDRAAKLRSDHTKK